MQKEIKILVNGITIDDANLTPLSRKIKSWKKDGAKIVLLGTDRLKQRLGSESVDEHIRLIDAKNLGGGFSFIASSLRRNFVCIAHLKRIHDMDVTYSISSVLDLVILPYILKKTNKTKKWVTVFDNTVPIISKGKLISGNLIVRFLAWIFFQVSLWFLKSADFIFVVKPELKEYLLHRGFKREKLIVTGNGVEKDLIVRAKLNKQYPSDALFVGRINEAKGIYDLLLVVKQVVKIIPHFKLILMGSGDHKTITKYIAKIKEQKLSTNVKLIGFKAGQEKYDIIKSCKVFLFLSQTESVPVAPLEAVCAGKFTLVYDLDAYNMYKNNEIFRFKQGDYQSVSDKIVEIFKKGVFVNLPGVLLIDKYSWDAIAQKEYQYIVKN